MPDKAPPRRSAIDTLVARDHTAIFWFVVAVAVAGICTWYVNLMSQAYAVRPPFVVMDTAGSYYIPPGIAYNQLDAMHNQLTEMAVETMFDRGSEQVTYPERINLLFDDAGKAQLITYLRGEADHFQKQHVTQTLQIEKILLPPAKNRGQNTIATDIYGTVRRESFLAGKAQVNSYSFYVTLGWRRNDYLLNNRSFPSRVSLFKIHKFTPLDEPEEAAKEP